MKTRGQNVKIAHPGVGSFGHLAGVLVAEEIGASVTHVPYRGAGPALNDLLAGVADLSSISAGGARPLGKARNSKSYPPQRRNPPPRPPGTPAKARDGHQQPQTQFSPQRATPPRPRGASH